MFHSQSVQNFLFFGILKKHKSTFEALNTYFQKLKPSSIFVQNGDVDHNLGSIIPMKKSSPWHEYTQEAKIQAIKNTKHTTHYTYFSIT